MCVTKPECVNLSLHLNYVAGCFKFLKEEKNWDQYPSPYSPGMSMTLCTMEIQHTLPPLRSMNAYLPPFRTYFTHTLKGKSLKQTNTLTHF